MLYKKL